MPTPQHQLLLHDRRPEVELLLACSRTVIDSQLAGRIETLLQSELDWGWLVQSAIEQRVVPLLYWSLHAAFVRAVPAAAYERLRQNYHEGARYTLLLTGELLRLLAAFKQHGIETIPLKGPALAAIAYGNLSQRQFGDLDILVHKQDILRAQDILAAQGYQPQWAPGSRQEVEFLTSGQAHTFTRDDGQVVVELHYRINHRHFSFKLDHEQLWQRSQPAALAGTQVRGLSREDLLLTLCAHGATHCWGCLSWICDIAELLRADQPVDWQWLFETARSLGGRRMVYVGLLLAHDLLDAPLPERVLDDIRMDAGARQAALHSCDILFARVAGQLHLFEEHLYYLRVRERLRDRARYCFYVATTPFEDDFATVGLPVRFSFLYRPLRIFRILGKYALNVARAASRRLRTEPNRRRE